MPIVGPESMPVVVRALRAGEVAAIPTDTVYGLAAMPTDPTAVARLAERKGRDARQPIALLFDETEDITHLTEEESALNSILRFWPGPLTAVLRARPVLRPPLVTEAGTVGVRQPADDLARAVLRACGGVLAVTSANRSGEPPATSAGEVEAVFGPELLVLDGGPRAAQAASTVVDFTSDPPRLLREGPISAAELGLTVARPSSGSDR